MVVRRPAPDGGVAAAVESCQSNTKMKRMVMFGLRALSDLCTPPRGRFKENALDAVERHITRTLVEVSSNLGGDEEIMELVMKVCWGISKALEDYKDETLMTLFVNEGGNQAACAAVNGAPSESDILELTFGMVESFSSIGIELDGQNIATGLTKALSAKELSPSAAVKVAIAVNSIAHKADGAAFLASQGATNALVDFAGKQAASADPTTIDAVYYALIAAGHVARAGGCDMACVMATKAIVDKNKARKKILDAGSEALSGMLSLDQLTHCLESLEAVGTPERENALEILSAMSYVSEFAEAIVQSGSVPLLVQAINSTQDEIVGSREEVLMKGLIGTVTLLGRIARNSTYAAHVYDAGGLSAIATALGSVVDHAEAYAACCSALAQLSFAGEAYAVEVYDACGAIVISTLYQEAATPIVQEASLELLANLSMHESLCMPMIEASGFEVISYSLQYEVSNVPVQVYALKALLRLAPSVYVTSAIYQYGGFQGLAQTLQTNVRSEELVALAVRTLAVLALVSDCKAHASDGIIVDAVLYAMLEHLKNAMIAESGREVLDILATEDDADRHVANLDGALSAAVKNDEGAFKAMAAVAGLCRVQRLAVRFEDANAGNKILKQLAKIIDSPGSLAATTVSVGGQKMTLQEKLMRAAMTTLEVLATTMAGFLDTIVPEALQVAGSEKLLLILASGGETVDVMHLSIAHMVSRDRIEATAAVQKAVSCATGSLKRFSDYRNCCDILLDIIHSLISSQGGASIPDFVDRGGLKASLDHIRKNQYSEKTQINGWKIVHVVLQQSPDYADMLRNAGAVDLIQTSLRTHQNSRKLREVVGPIIGILIPINELEEMAMRNVAMALDGLDTNDLQKLEQAIKSCIDIAASSEGAKALAKHGAVDLIKKIEKQFEAKKVATKPILADTAHLSDLLTAQRPGLTAMNRGKVAENLLGLVDKNAANKDEEGGVVWLRRIIEPCVEHGVCALARLLPLDANANVRMHRDIVQTMSNVLTDYPNHATITPAACRAMGAVAKTDLGASGLVATSEVPQMLDDFHAELLGASNKATKVTVLGAMADLTLHSQPILTDVVSEKEFVPLLYDILEKQPDDNELVKNAAKAFERIGKGSVVKLRDFWENQKPAGTEINDVSETFSICIKANIHDTECVASLVGALATMMRLGDQSVLRETDLTDAIRQALAVSPDNDHLNEACAELMRNLGAGSLIQGRLNMLIGKLQAGDAKASNNLMEELSLLLLANVDDPDVQLDNEEALWPLLLEKLRSARETNDIKSMRNVFLLAQRLVEQGKQKPEGYRGAWYYSQFLLPECVDIIESDGTVMQAKRLVTAMMDGLAGVAGNAYTRQFALDQLPINTLLELLEANQHDQDIVASIVNLLYHLGMDSAGIQKFSGANKDAVPILANIMRVHKGRVNICQPALRLLGTFAQPDFGGTKATSPCFTSGEAILAAQRAPNVAPGAQGYLDADMMDTMAAAVSNSEIIEEVIVTQILRKCIKKLENDPEEDVLIGNRKMEGLDSAETIVLRNNLAVINLMEAYTLAGHAAHVHDKGGVQKLIEMLEEYADNQQVYNGAVSTLATIQMSDPTLLGEDMTQQILTKTLGPVMPTDVDEPNMSVELDKEIGKLLLLDGENDPTASYGRVRALVNMLEALAAGGGHNKLLTHANIKALLAKSEEVALNCEDGELASRIQVLSGVTEETEITTMAFGGPAMGTDLSKTEADVDPDDPDALTLKQVHDWLAQRLEEGLSIDVNDESEPLLYERFVFVYSKLSDYNKLHLELKDFAGWQTEYGCKSWILWTTYTPEILPTLLGWGCHTLMFDFINNQKIDVKKGVDKAVVIGTPVSATIAAFASVRDPGGTTLAELPNVAADCVSNIEICMANKGTRKDEHIIPRLEMVEKIAINRIIFADPDVVLCLLKAWDLYDEGVFSSLALRHVFRAMRRVVCESHTDTVIENNVTQRLIDELKKDFDNPLLIDGFFLLGVLSVDSRLKTMIGEQNGITISLDILSNHMNDPPGEGVVTNSQLALANLVVGHRKNCNIFLKHQGLQLNVQVLKSRGEQFDETNAASALLTNACFRREDIKASYGEPTIGAPAALAYAISCYDGGTDPVALRCLTNMFKAISNMALYTPNVERFLDSGLENAYYNLLVQSAGLPDDIVKTGLFTLSNLTWENKEENMKKFGIIVPPLVEMASQQGREDASLLGSTLETLAFLCRLQENARAFTEYGGVSLTTGLIEQHGAYSSYVLQQALKCLGIVARDKEFIAYLLQADCLTLIIKILEGHFYQEQDTQQTQFEVSLNSLRVVRKIITQGGAETAATFSQLGGMATLTWYIDTVAATEDPLPLLALECIRAIVGSIAVAQGDDSDAYVSIDDQLDAMEYEKKKGGGLFSKKKATTDDEELGALERPQTPRGYEVVGLDAESVSSVVAALCTLATHDSLQRSLRFIRCHFGFLAYVAAEVIPGCENLLFDNANAIGVIMKRAYEEHDVNRELMLLIMSIFANLGYHNPTSLNEFYGKTSNAFKIASEMEKRLGNLKEKEKVEKERSKKFKDKFEDFMLAWRAICEGDDGAVMRKFASYDTDFSLTLWHKDPYPNGVHDLPIKEELRAGGRFKIVVDEKTRDSFFWRANQTLALLQWRVEKDKNIESQTPILEFNTGVPVSKVSCVMKGLGNELLRKAAKKQRGITSDLCLVIQGPATEDYPNGFDFGIKCKTKEERDQFCDWLLEWRDACNQ